ncbi:hypothetical protein RI367_008212 [Sorochytrium milnesiophthora]
MSPPPLPSPLSSPNMSLTVVDTAADNNNNNNDEQDMDSDSLDCRMSRMSQVLESLISDAQSVLSSPAMEDDNAADEQLHQPADGSGLLDPLYEHEELGDASFASFRSTPALASSSARRSRAPPPPARRYQHIPAASADADVDPSHAYTLAKLSGTEPTSRRRLSGPLPGSQSPPTQQQLLLMQRRQTRSKPATLSRTWRKSMHSDEGGNSYVFGQNNGNSTFAPPPGGNDHSYKLEMMRRYQNSLAETRRQYPSRSSDGYAPPPSPSSASMYSNLYRRSPPRSSSNGSYSRPPSSLLRMSGDDSMAPTVEDTDYDPCSPADVCSEYSITPSESPSGYGYAPLLPPTPARPPSGLGLRSAYYHHPASPVSAANPDSALGASDDQRQQKQQQPELVPIDHPAVALPAAAAAAAAAAARSSRSRSRPARYEIRYDGALTSRHIGVFGMGPKRCAAILCVLYFCLDMRSFATVCFIGVSVVLAARGLWHWVGELSDDIVTFITDSKQPVRGKTGAKSAKPSPTARKAAKAAAAVSASATTPAVTVPQPTMWSGRRPRRVMRFLGLRSASSGSSAAGAAPRVRRSLSAASSSASSTLKPLSPAIGLCDPDAADAESVVDENGQVIGVLRMVKRRMLQR